MAASIRYYDSNTLNVRVNGVEYMSLVALQAAYGTEEQIMSLFNVDYVHKVGDGKFIGALRVEGSNNLIFHDTKNLNPDGTTNNKGDAANHQRLSRLLVKATDGRMYVLLNDAGLNTKPYILPNPYIVYSNFIVYQFVFRSAYFFASSGMEAKIMSSDGTVEHDVTLAKTTMAARETYNTPIVGEAPPFTLTQGSTILFSAQATNAEGTAEQVITMTALKPITYPYHRISWFEELPETVQQFNAYAVGYDLWMWQEDYDTLSTLTTSDDENGPYAYQNYWLNNYTSRKALIPGGWFFKGDKNSGYSRFFKVTSKGRVVSYQDVYLQDIPEQVAITVSVTTHSDSYYNYIAYVDVSYLNVEVPQDVDVTFTLRGELNGAAAIGVTFSNGLSYIDVETSLSASSDFTKMLSFLFHREEDLTSPPNIIGVINPTCTPDIYTFDITEGNI